MTDVCRTIDEDDLDEIIKYLKDIMANYFTLGTALKLRHATMNTIRMRKLDPPEALLEVINEWLSKNYNFEKFGKPTWKALVEAVASPMGGNNTGLALKIAEDHPASQFVFIIMNY